MRNPDLPLNNVAVLNISQIIKVVISLASKSELGALLINAKYAVLVRKTLEAMGHPQSPTPTQMDTSTSYGVVNNNIHPKSTKSTDMRFLWLQDRECQKNSKYIRDLTQQIWEIIGVSITQVRIIKITVRKLSYP